MRWFRSKSNTEPSLDTARRIVSRVLGRPVDAAADVRLSELGLDSLRSLRLYLELGRMADLDPEMFAQETAAHPIRTLGDIAAVLDACKPIRTTRGRR